MSTEQNKDWQQRVVEFQDDYQLTNIGAPPGDIQLCTIQRTVLWFEALYELLCVIERPVGIIMFGPNTDKHYDVCKLIRETFERSAFTEQGLKAEYFDVDKVFSEPYSKQDCLPEPSSQFCLYDIRHGLAAVPEQRKLLVEYLRLHADFSTIVGVYVGDEIKDASENLKSFATVMAAGKIEEFDGRFMLEHIAIRELERNPPQAREVDFLFVV